MAECSSGQRSQHVSVPDVFSRESFSYLVQLGGGTGSAGGASERLSICSSLEGNEAAHLPAGFKDTICSPQLDAAKAQAKDADNVFKDECYPLPRASPWALRVDHEDYVTHVRPVIPLGPATTTSPDLPESMRQRKAILAELEWLRVENRLLREGPHFDELEWLRVENSRLRAEMLRNVSSREYVVQDRQFMFGCFASKPHVQRADCLEVDPQPLHACPQECLSSAKVEAHPSLSPTPTSTTNDVKTNLAMQTNEGEVTHEESLLSPTAASLFGRVMHPRRSAGRFSPHGQTSAQGMALRIGTLACSSSSIHDGPEGCGQLEFVWRSRVGIMVSRTYGRVDALGETQLIAAVRQGNLPGAKRLLESCTAPDAEDRFGETALMEAAARGDAAICRLLLLHGADPSHRATTLESHEECGLSATDLAKEHAALASVFAVSARSSAEHALRLAAGRHDLVGVERLLKRHITQ